MADEAAAMEELPDAGQLDAGQLDAGAAQDDGDWVDMGGYRVLRTAQPVAEVGSEPSTSRRKRRGPKQATQAKQPKQAKPAPQPREPRQPAPGAPPRPRALGRDSVAVAALVTGLLGPLGVPFGLVARARIHRSGQRGERFAMAGIVLGALWLVVAAVVVAASALKGDGPPAAPSRDAARALGVGDCVLAADPALATPADRVPCDQAHDAEVYSVFPVGGTTWPGAAVVLAKAEGNCPKRLPDYVSDSRAERFTPTWITPDEPAWNSGKRTISCLLTAVDGKALRRSHRA